MQEHKELKNLEHELRKHEQQDEEYKRSIEHRMKDGGCHDPFHMHQQKNR